MEASPVSVRNKRGCLWYVGITTAGIFGVLALLVVAYIFSPDEPSQHSIAVSADNQTYLEAVTERCYRDVWGDDCDETSIYYVSVGGWFMKTKRVRVYEGVPASPSQVSFRRRTDPEGRLQIEVKRKKYESDIIEEIRRDMPPYAKAIHRKPDGTYDVLLEKRFRQAQKDSLDKRLLQKDSVVVMLFTPPATFPDN
jgi:hypothetical protein